MRSNTTIPTACSDLEFRQQGSWPSPLLPYLLSRFPTASGNSRMLGTGQRSWVPHRFASFPLRRTRLPNASGFCRKRAKGVQHRADHIYHIDPERKYSPAHYLHTVGVTGSIPVAPTIQIRSENRGAWLRVLDSASRESSAPSGCSIHSLARLLQLTSEQPAEKHRRHHGSCELSGDKANDICRANTGKRVGQRPCNRDGRVCKGRR